MSIENRDTDPQIQRGCLIKSHSDFTHVFLHHPEGEPAWAGGSCERATTPLLWQPLSSDSSADDRCAHGGEDNCPTLPCLLGGGAALSGLMSQGQQVGGDSVMGPSTRCTLRVSCCSSYATHHNTQTWSCPQDRQALVRKANETD